MIANSISHPSFVPWAIAIGLVTYVTTRVIYHLYLSPLAKFPGPKLAAVTRWYEFYYDVVLDGSYIFKIQKLHEQYGPIIRVTPYELHVNDPDFFDILYSIRGRRDKYEWSAGRFGVPHAFFSTPDHELHRMRRAPMQSMFSKQKIIEFEPYLQEKLNLLYRVVRDEYSNSNKVLRLDRAASAFSGDIVSEYAFGKSFNTLESKDFSESLHEAFLAAVQTGAISLQFPWLPVLLKSLPSHWTLKLQPQLAQLFHVEKVVYQLVEDVRRGQHEEYKTTGHPTIFQELLDSDLPESEKSPGRLRQEAQSLIGAGFSTTAWVICVGCVYILSDPAIEEKLRSELHQAIPIASQPPKWVELEQLPYLKGCVYESIRLSYGAVARLQRIAPDQTLYYNHWAIPPGTPVSQSHFIINHNETVFPDSYSFRPERWIDFGMKMEKYVFSFSKGTRRCIGVNLATAEAFMLLAMLFRRVKMQLFETDRTNVECIHDWFIPGVKRDSKGIQVKVGSVE